ncbi:MAG TPA: hypothetical protein VFM68_00480 [Candidatus Saccharimonadales bacterium]|nr:hypothetical protein [Candidatus Saccharimonadales bacterium]
MRKPDSINRPLEYNDPPQGVCIVYDSAKGEFVEGTEIDTTDNPQRHRLDDKSADNEQQQSPINKTRQKVGRAALISLLAVTPFVAVDTAGTFVKTGEIRNVQELVVDAAELPEQVMQLGENASDIVNDLGTLVELFSLGEEQ